MIPWKVMSNIVMSQRKWEMRISFLSNFVNRGGGGQKIGQSKYQFDGGLESSGICTICIPKIKYPKKICTPKIKDLALCIWKFDAIGDWIGVFGPTFLIWNFAQFV